MKKRVLKYECPVCSKIAFSTRGNYEICDNCFWEDDGSTEPYQGSDGPNLMNMRNYRELFLKKQKEKKIK